jgi:hypothetical protein
MPNQPGFQIKRNPKMTSTNPFHKTAMDIAADLLASFGQANRLYADLRGKELWISTPNARFSIVAIRAH